MKAFFVMLHLYCLKEIIFMLQTDMAHWSKQLEVTTTVHLNTTKCVIKVVQVSSHITFSTQWVET